MNCLCVLQVFWKSPGVYSRYIGLDGSSNHDRACYDQMMILVRSNYCIIFFMRCLIVYRLYKVHSYLGLFITLFRLMIFKGMVQQFRNIKPRQSHNSKVKMCSPGANSGNMSAILFCRVHEMEIGSTAFASR